MNPEREPSKTATPHLNVGQCLEDENLLYKYTIAVLSEMTFPSVYFRFKRRYKLKYVEKRAFKAIT